MNSFQLRLRQIRCHIFMMFWQFGIYSIQNFKMEITKKENYQSTLNIFVAKKVSVNRFFCRTYLQEYYMGIFSRGNGRGGCWNLYENWNPQLHFPRISMTSHLSYVYIYYSSTSTQSSRTMLISLNKTTLVWTKQKTVKNKYIFKILLFKKWSFYNVA